MPCEANPDLWFPDDLVGEDKDIAEQVAIAACKVCPVKKLCAAFALESQQEFGIWGGTLPSDRL